MATATRRRRRPADVSWDPSAHVPIEELTLIESWHPNVMVAGPRAATVAALSALRSVFRTPLCEWRPGHPLSALSIGAARTLILNDASALTAEDQQLLHSWLQSGDRTLQVVSATDVPILPLIQAGTFDGALYYALNVIYLEVSDQPPAGFVGSTCD
jgi:hypothetical protein